MPTYDIQAKNNQGKIISGKILASSEEEAYRKMVKSGLIPKSIIEIPEAFDIKKFLNQYSRISLKALMFFSKQLSSMVGAGLPIARCLETLAEEEENENFARIIKAVSAEIQSGIAFNEALSKYPKVFPKIYIKGVKAGEAAGELDKILGKLSTQLENDYETISRIRSAMMYPIFVLVILVAVGVALLTWVIPQIKGIFVDTGMVLPLPTRLLIGLSDAIIHYGLIMLGGLVGALFGFKYYINTEQGRFLWDSFKLKIPVLGKLFQKVYMDRFTGTLGTLLAAGLPILEAIEITGEAIGNKKYQSFLMNAREVVKDGTPLSVPVKESKLFPRMVSQMLVVGEETGKTDESLDELEKFYHREVEIIVKSISSLIEPVLILIIGLAVSALIASIIWPIYNLTNSL
ncbi:hypothetical protein AUK11_01390 [bacterium CG2_30_37_16]|nr:MAG: hypothetical protein AUK11_01390 [bacterium CG2_30_37_16]PIP31265.1 MAG: hypothetical protein COX25_00195 [bacterium (Candidatus Howlettbacteria) CG23_combo_of_CG06-09_8_20_14_all_37_9]PJB05693.1 MAG: hypothetical protein CO123_03590 [bacterium (Candidatus Howlettbacteria) CG_4_9_14_3_um_filter_37_10]